MNLPATGLEHGATQVGLTPAQNAVASGVHMANISSAAGQSPSPRAKASDVQMLAMLTGQRDTAGSMRDVFEHGGVQGGRGAAP